MRMLKWHRPDPAITALEHKLPGSAPIFKVRAPNFMKSRRGHPRGERNDRETAPIESFPSFGQSVQTDDQSRDTPGMKNVQLLVEFFTLGARKIDPFHKITERFR